MCESECDSLFPEEQRGTDLYSDNPTNFSSIQKREHDISISILLLLLLLQACSHHSCDTITKTVAGVETHDVSVSDGRANAEIMSVLFHNRAEQNTAIRGGTKEDEVGPEVRWKSKGSKIKCPCR